MKRLLVAGLLFSAAVLGVPGVASAHLHYISFDDTAVVDDNGAVITGVIECHLGWNYAVTVRLEDGEGHRPGARLAGRPVCTATPQPFEIRVKGDFPEGPAAISVSARGGTRSEGVLHSLTSTGIVQLRNG